MRTTVAVAVACLLFGGISVAQDARATSRRSTNIPAQGLGAALQALANDRNLQLIYASAEVDDLHTAGAVGELTVDEALTRLLAGTGLTYTFLDDQTITVAPAASSGNEVTTGVDESPPPSQDRVEVEEVVVTGTHIRNQPNTASPIRVFSREEIQRSGFGSVQQFLNALPDNFSGGVSEATGVGQSLVGGSGGISSGAGINLRGLGNAATLVLINGRRVAPAGMGEYVDVSLVPLSAVERIDVMKDGASAIYGSDAVAGVVNIVLRERYDGFETHLRSGVTTGGGADEIRADQTVGKSWDSGRALVTYDFQHRGRLRTADRAFTETADQPSDLLPKQERHSVVTSVSQAVGQGIRMFADGLFSDREFGFVNTSGGDTGVRNGRTRLYSGTLGARINVGADWHAQISGSYSRNDVDTLFTNSGISGSFSERIDSALRYEILDGFASGPLLQLRAGDVRAAFGVQYRRESLRASAATDGVQSSSDSRARRVVAGYAELTVPVVSESNALALLNRLEITAAARSEHYSDFGSTFDPKIGLSLSPWQGLNIRATYGRSFKAPLLDQLDETQQRLLVFPLPDPQSAGGSTPTILVIGNNAQLEPERSSAWTVGLDYVPAENPLTKLSLTYFDIDFSDRIAVPAPGLELFSFLSSPTLAPFVTRSPSLDVIEDFFGQAGFENPFGFEPSGIGAIADDRLRNLSRTLVRGATLEMSMARDLSVGRMGGGIDVNYYFTYRNQTTSLSPSTSIRSTVFNPVNLKARGSLWWTRGALRLAGFLNFTNDYDNNLADPNERVPSWTTMDIQVAYDTSNGHGPRWMRDVRIALSGINITDKDPPAVRTNSVGLNYDGANADVLGRLIAVELSKAW